MIALWAAGADRWHRDERCGGLALDLDRLQQPAPKRGSVTAAEAAGVLVACSTCRPGSGGEQAFETRQSRRQAERQRAKEERAAARVPRVAERRA